MKKFGIIKGAYLRLIMAVVLVGGSWIIFGLNVRFSTEFTGGLAISFENGNVEKEKITKDMEWFLQKNGFTDTTVEVKNMQEITDLTIKTNVNDDERVNVLSENIKSFLIEDKYISNIDQITNLSITGPSVGSYMQKVALNALVLGLIFMVVYMLFSFASIRKYISPSILAMVTVVTMIFDISIPTGAYGVWMMFNPTIQINTIFIIAILTTMGYSINDTIVIFDRIRENMKEHGDRQGGNLVYGKIFEKSLWQTIRRSIGTSLSTLLIVIAMYIFGAGVIQQFSFTVGIGVIAGTFSSIFVAAPLAYILLGKYKKEKNKF